MKHAFLSLFCIVFFVGAYAQPKIVDFLSATISVPVDKKISITDVIYREGKFDTIQERTAKGRKFKHDNKNDGMGTMIDEAQLVNYKSDTLYILSPHYIPDASASTIIKTRKGAFDFIYNVDGGYSIRSLGNSYANISEDEKVYDFLLYEAIFTWNIDLLIRLIKSSGGLLGSENMMSATRIILKENQVLKKTLLILNLHYVGIWNNVYRKLHNINVSNSVFLYYFLQSHQKECKARCIGTNLEFFIYPNTKLYSKNKRGVYQIK